MNVFKELAYLAGVACIAPSTVLATPQAPAAAPGHLQSVAIGKTHTCAISEEGRAYCWGENDRGQLGDGSLGPRTSAGDPVFQLEQVVSIHNGAIHSCARTVAGKVYCWGSNDAGQLGVGLESDEARFSVIPLPVSGIQSARDLAVGRDHACAVDASGGVHCWGKNHRGQLGKADPAMELKPVKVPGVEGAVAVAAGRRHSCALLESGGVICWGDNALGQLGTGKRSSTELPSSPVSGLRNAVQIEAGTFHACAVTADGRLYCWGYNVHGQLGNGFGIELQPVPNQVVGLTEVRDVGAGDQHTCAITGDSERALWCWGDNADGRLGIGSERPYFIPARVSGVQTPLQITAGNGSSCAVDGFRRVQCWGGGAKAPQTAPFEEPAHVASDALPPAPAIVGRTLGAGAGFTCAVSAERKVHCWGEMDGSNGNSTPDRPIEGLDEAVSVAVADKSACALTAGREVYCWGSADAGQLANGSTSGFVSSPARVDLPAPVVSISAGDRHYCATDTTGKLWCWGSNDHGQLGNGTKESRTAPVQVIQLDGVIHSALGTSHSCALTRVGQVHCWGRNEDGQLGQGDTTASLRPKRVPGLEGVTALFANERNTCALLGDGSAWCWGENEQGNIGDGSTVDLRKTPTRVAGSASFAKIGISTDAHVCSADRRGQVWCWGLDSFGAVGNGNTNTQRTPQKVNGLENIVDVAGGSAHSCALRQDGTVLCWGGNGNGQLGGRTSGDRSPTPIPVPLGVSADVSGSTPRSGSPPSHSQSPGTTEPSRTTTPENGEAEQGENYDDEF